MQNQSTQEPGTGVNAFLRHYLCDVSCQSSFTICRFFLSVSTYLQKVQQKSVGLLFSNSRMRLSTACTSIKL